MEYRRGRISEEYRRWGTPAIAAKKGCDPRAGAPLSLFPSEREPRPPTWAEWRCRTHQAFQRRGGLGWGAPEPRPPPSAPPSPGSRSRAGSCALVPEVDPVRRTDEGQPSDAALGLARDIQRQLAAALE